MANDTPGFEPVTSEASRLFTADKAKEIFETYIQPGLLPTIGAMAGGALAAPAGVAPLGATAGAGFGTFLNQRLGITEPSMTEYLFSAAPPMASAALRGGPVGMTSLPGAAQGLQDLAVSRLGWRGAKLLQEIRPPVPSRDLFQRVYQTGQAVKATNAATVQALTEARGELVTLSTKLQPSGIGQLLDGIEETVISPAGSRGTAAFIPFNDFDKARSALGAKMQHIIATGGEGKGLAKKMYAAMWTDIEASLAQAPPALRPLLQDAVATRKAEEGISFLKRFMNQGFKYRAGERSVNIDPILSKIDENRDILRKLLPDGDVDGIMETLQRWKWVPMADKTSQQGLAGITYGQRAIVGGAMGGAANLLGAPGAAQGLAGGFGATVAVEALSHMLASVPGRILIKQLAARGTTIDQVINALAQTAVTATGLRGQGPPDMEGFSPMGLQTPPLQ